MGFSTKARLLICAVMGASSFLALGVGAATASARPGVYAHSQGKMVGLSNARALNAPCRGGLTLRLRLVRRAGRCVARGSAAATPRPIYWGATIGDQITGTQAPWDMSAVSQFEAITGKGMSMLNFFQPFAECGSGNCSFYPFPDGALELIRQHGSIPMLTWASQSTPSSLEEPEFQLSDVIEGKYDAYLHQFAGEARAWGHPFFLRFNWEMNGNWFPWSEQVNGNGPGQYVAAWRHVHDIFTSAGATNVSWVWCPMVDPGGNLQELSGLYPGDTYVDWTGLDGYNWGTNPAAPRGWRSFGQLFKSTYEEIIERIAPSKPVMIGEFGSSEYGGSKAGWIEEALSEIPTEYPEIRGILWFDKPDDNMDWPIESSASAEAAFAHQIQSPIYVANSYAGLAAGPLPVAG